MSNLLEAIVHIAAAQSLIVTEQKTGNNRINNMGEGLELFVKNAFAGCLMETDESVKAAKYASAFSWEGSRTRIPDLILKNSDAIEIKKVESVDAPLQLNSSYPKAKLKADTNIKKECRNCESLPWIEKDIIYVVGHLPKKTKKLAAIWLVYGAVYAAEEEVYQAVKQKISKSIQSAGLNLSPSKEIGRINGVDVLENSSLRIRAMWLLAPPKQAFEEVYKYDAKAEFQLVAIVSQEKYNSFAEASRTKIEGKRGINISDIAVKNPNDADKMIAAKLISITK